MSSVSVSRDYDDDNCCYLYAHTSVIPLDEKHVSLRRAIGSEVVGIGHHCKDKMSNINIPIVTGFAYLAERTVRGRPERSQSVWSSPRERTSRS